MSKKIIIVGLVSLVLGCNALPSNKLSNNVGFHNVWQDSNIVYGQKGGMVYVLDERGWPRSLGYHVITPTSGGFKTSLGACEYSLDKKGHAITILTDICGCETAPTVFGRENEKLSIFRRR
jgi:hypothetical protein